MKGINTLHKTLSLLLVLCMAVSFLSVVSFADGEDAFADPTADNAPTAEEGSGAGEDPASESSADETPADDVPANDTPADDIPADEVLPAAGTEAPEAEDENITVTFETDGNATVNIFYGKDYTGEPDETDVSSAYARAKAGDGSIDNSGNGQVNFAVVPAEGYVVDSIIGTPEEAFKTLKGSDDTGVEGVYRITKINADMIVTITTKAAGEEPEEPGEPAEPEEPVEEADPFTFYLTPEGFTDSLGVPTGKDSLKLKDSGTYTVIGQDLTDYVTGRIQIKAPDVKLILQDVRLVYPNAAVINTEFDAVLDIYGDCRVKRVIDPELFKDKDFDEDGYCDEDGGKVIKGESETFGEAVSIEITGPGCLTIDAPKKGIGVDVYMDTAQNPEEKMTVKLDATITIDMTEPESGSDQPYNLVIRSAHEAMEANVIIFKSGIGMLDSTNTYEWRYTNPVTKQDIFCSYTGDDGINAATDADDKVDRNGNDTEGSGEPKFNVKYDFLDMYIEFSGGTWFINTAEDGLDSNGSVFINGGQVTVFSEPPDGPTPPCDGGAVDYADDSRALFDYTGGTLLTAGSNLIQKMPTSGIYLYFSGRSSFGGFGSGPTSNVEIFAGDHVSIVNKDGIMLEGSEFDAIKSANGVLFLSEDLVLGEQYTLVINGQTDATVTAKEKGSGGSSNEPGGGQQGWPGGGQQGWPGGGQQGRPGWWNNNNNSSNEPSDEPSAEPEPAPVAVTLSEDATSARVENFRDGLYVRAAFLLDKNGVSGLYITQCAVSEDGEVLLPAFNVPGLTVTGICVAVVDNLQDISAAEFTPVNDAVATLYL